MKRYYLDLSECTLISDKKLWVNARNKNEAIDAIHRELFKMGHTKISKVWISGWLKTKV